MSDRRDRSRALVAAVLAATVGVLPVFLVGGVAVQIRADLGFGAAALGAAIAAFFAGAALGSRPLGHLTERLGPVRSLRVAAGGSAATLVAIAAGARSLPALVALLALGGVINGLTQPAANLTLARAIPERRKGLAFGIKQSAVPTATMLAGLAVPSLAMTVGWRWAFAMAAALAALTLFVVPSRIGPPEERPPGAPGPGPDAARATLVWMATGIGFGAAAANALGSFLVSSAVEAGIGNELAGLLLTGGSLAGMATRLAVGARADGRGGGHLRVVALMLALGTVAYLSLALGSGWAHLLATPLAFAAGWGWPGLFNLAVVRAAPRAPGAATGVTQTGTYLGAGGGPLLFGLLADRLGYAVAWYSSAGFALLAVLAVLHATRRLRREGRPS